MKIKVTSLIGLALLSSVSIASAQNERAEKKTERAEKKTERTEVRSKTDKKAKKVVIQLPNGKKIKYVAGMTIQPGTTLISGPEEITVKTASGTILVLEPQSVFTLALASESPNDHGTLFSGAVNITTTGETKFVITTNDNGAESTTTVTSDSPDTRIEVAPESPEIVIDFEPGDIDREEDPSPTGTDD